MDEDTRSTYTLNRLRGNSGANCSLLFDVSFQILALTSNLTDVQKSKIDEEAAKRTAEETVERERKENEEKVSVPRDY